jgi:hypothetical protein
VGIPGWLLMGVSMTIYVVAPYGEFIHHAIRLNDDKGLVDPLETYIKENYHHKWPQLQLPNGAWCNYSGEVPKGFEDRESGWLQDDCYGNAFKAIKGKQLANIKREEDGSFLWPSANWDDSFNKAMFTFIVKHFPEHDIVVFFH